MPKFTFECVTCTTNFTRTLKMGPHPTHPCPACKAPAPRLWNGQSFGFDFSATAATAQGNSGVSKHDHPTADQAVGRSANARWAEIQEREKVKDEVRKVGGHRALKRRTGEKYVEYEAGDANLIEKRKKLVAGANRAYEKQEAEAR